MNAASGAGAPLNRGMITVSIMLATIMQVLDTTIANVALPNMQGSLGAAQDQISWVLTSYIVSAAIMTPLTGVLAMRLGRKRLFIGAVIGFTIASMLCGSATSLTETCVPACTSSCMVRVRPTSSSISRRAAAISSPALR